MGTTKLTTTANTKSKPKRKPNKTNQMHNSCCVPWKMNNGSELHEKNDNLRRLKLNVRINCLMLCVLYIYIYYIYIHMSRERLGRLTIFTEWMNICALVWVTCAVNFLLVLYTLHTFSAPSMFDPASTEYCRGCLHNRNNSSNKNHQTTSWQKSQLDDFSCCWDHLDLCGLWCACMCIVFIRAHNSFLDSIIFTCFFLFEFVC